MNFSAPLPAYAHEFGIALLVFGIIQCFFGYRLWPFIRAIAGFCAGFLICVFLVYLADRNYNECGIWGLVVPLVTAVIFAALKKIGTFLYGALVYFRVCFLICLFIGLHVQSNDENLIWLFLLISVVAGIVGGTITLDLGRTGIIAASSFGGAIFILDGRNVLVTTAFGSVREFQTVWIICAFLAVVGILFQNATTPKIELRDVPRESAKEKEKEPQPNVHSTP